MTDAGDIRPAPEAGDELPAVVERGEVLDAAEPGVAERIAQLPAPVLAAAGGFVAGFATLVVVRVLRGVAAAPGRVLLRRRRRRDVRSIEATRSFLVDIHLLKR